MTPDGTCYPWVPGKMYIQCESCHGVRDYMPLFRSPHSSVAIRSGFCSPSCRSLRSTFLAMASQAAETNGESVMESSTKKRPGAGPQPLVEIKKRKTSDRGDESLQKAIETIVEELCAGGAPLIWATLDRIEKNSMWDEKKTPPNLLKMKLKSTFGQLDTC